MAIITKKELYELKSKPKKKLVDEFVDLDGSFIDGDEVESNTSQIEVPNQQTTDDFVAKAIQPNKPIGGIANYNFRRIGENKIKNIISNLLENETKDIKELSNTKPISVNKAREVINTIKKNALNSEEIGILLKYIFDNINLTELPQAYKDNLKSKL